jgi:hypothetical protein
MESGWISSMVIVSAPLMGLVDRMADLVTGTRFLDKVGLRPVGSGNLLTGHFLVVLILVLVRGQSAESPQDVEKRQVKTVSDDR